MSFREVKGIKTQIDDNSDNKKEGGTSSEPKCKISLESCISNQCQPKHLTSSTLWHPWWDSLASCVVDKIMPMPNHCCPYDEYSTFTDMLTHQKNLPCFVFYSHSSYHCALLQRSRSICAYVRSYTPGVSSTAVVFYVHLLMWPASSDPLSDGEWELWRGR